MQRCPLWILDLTVKRPLDRDITTPESSKGSPKVIFPSRYGCPEGKTTFGKAWISSLLKGFTPSTTLAWHVHVRRCLLASQSRGGPKQSGTCPRAPPLEPR